MMGDNESFANYLGVDYEKKGNLIKINCPFHLDSHPSFVIYPELERGGYCFACGQDASWAWLATHIKGISYRQALEDLGQETLEPSAVKNIVKPPSPMSFCDEPNPKFVEAFEQKFAQCSDEYPNVMVDWLEKKRLLDTARKLGWKWHAEGVFRHWKNGIVIPYHINGKIAYVRFRGLENDSGKFAKPKGPMDVGIQPYYDTFRPNDTVFIVEGESDAASVYAHGMSAIGLPGACSKKAVNSAVAFIADHSYIKRVVCCGDNDQAGQKMNELIRQSLLEFEVKCEIVLYHVESPDEKADLNDDHVAGLFKPPVQWGMSYKDNYNRNFPDNDFGDFVDNFSSFLGQCEEHNYNPWRQAGNIEILNPAAEKRCSPFCK